MIHKRAGLHPLSRKHNLKKNSRGWIFPPLAFLGLTQQLIIKMKNYLKSTADVSFKAREV